MEDRWSTLPRLMTPRLVLRPLGLNDADDVHAYMSNPAVADKTTWEPHADYHASQVFVEKVIEHYQAGPYFSWALEERATGRVIGTCGLDGSWNQRHQRAELAYALAEDRWGQGLMVEACVHILLFGFASLHLHRISAMCLSENVQSERVMQKLNMTYEGTLWDYLYAKGRFRTVKLYAILSHEFFAKDGRHSIRPRYQLGD
jgi:ribosomal-protein-alanine N-acetyltransferase